jgi:hypothetical protein
MHLTASNEVRRSQMHPFIMYYFVIQYFFVTFAGFCYDRHDGKSSLNAGYIACYI